jgi:hypothetical protein
MTFLTFLGALALSVLAFELLTFLQRATAVFGTSRLSNMGNTTASHRSTWEALLVTVLLGRFDPENAKNSADLISLHSCGALATLMTLPANFMPLPRATSRYLLP